MKPLILQHHENFLLSHSRPFQYKRKELQRLVRSDFASHKTSLPTFLPALFLSFPLRKLAILNLNNASCPAASSLVPAEAGEGLAADKAHHNDA
jgi:hypothetical protein